jgi:hypothetical protein
MRQAYSDIGWLINADGSCAGLSLGYDRCAEHEWGIDGLLAEFGIDLPDLRKGVEDHIMTRIPEAMYFFEYTAKSKDKRRKGYPAAMLVVSDRVDPSSISPSNPAERFGLHFFPDHPADKRNRPEWDVLCAWGRDDLAVHVRGQENIERLKQLHAAILAKDVALGTPWAKSFFRGGISLAIYSRISDEEKQAIATKYAEHNELEEAVRVSGIREKLEKAGKRFYALSPAWTDEAKTQLCFFLNPCEQNKYQHGWFTLDELDAWTREDGPIPFNQALREYEKRPENYNWPYRLVSGLKNKGLALRWGAVLCWLDKPGGTPGVRIVAHHTCGDRLTSGTYPFEQFMAQYAEPLNVKEEQAG